MAVIAWIKTIRRRIAPAFLLLACLPFASHAEVILDGTVGPRGPIAGPDYMIPDTVGFRVRNNLFHSFQTFNIHTGESGTFTGPDSIQNVIGRVTGGASSLIDGRLSCSIPGADLFLINPWGMIFGANASLDVTGSFYAGTADYLKLGELGRFDAIHPE
jgi:filamentous hemagglutinin family protein